MKLLRWPAWAAPLRQKLKVIRGPVWAFLNVARVALKTDVLNKLAARKNRSKLGRKTFVYAQRGIAILIGLFTWAVLQAATTVLAVLVPISLALLVAGMWWAGAGEIE